jgi:DNA-directed RNA polymerase specialized sigma24 family protein
MDNEQLLEMYYKNNGAKLHRIVDKILCRFGGIYNKDYDDFYSLANEVFADVLNRFDDSCDFEVFLRNCLLKRVKTEITRRNRLKRQTDLTAISLDTPVGGEKGYTVGDGLVSKFDMNSEISEEIGILREEKVERYLNRISSIQRKIVVMRMKGYEPFEIRHVLDITQKQYNGHMNTIRSYENKKALLRKDKTEKKKNEEEILLVETPAQIGERTKNTSYALSALIKKLHNYSLRDDHILQRSSGQWNSSIKGELVSDILQGRSLLPIIVSEEKAEGMLYNWLIDGLQRCSTIDDYKNDGFSIYHNVKLYNICYQTIKKDKQGKIMFDGNDNPIYENKIFDIRKKKFSELPEELKDKFLEYQIPVMLNLDCTKKEIAYDIARFNRCRPMTKSQLGVLSLEEGLGEIVNNIIKMEFFHNESKSSYKQSDFRTSNMKRMIVESVMVTNFLEDWNKNIEKVCEYLSENQCESYFIEFYDIIERLTKVSNKDIAEMFTIKDSFIWFALFNKFTKLEINDLKYVEFMKELKTDLHSHMVNGTTYDELDQKSNKDKKTIVNKLELLNYMMEEYLSKNKDGTVIDKKRIQPYGQCLYPLGV